jgi:hypothetical protein
VERGGFEPPKASPTDLQSVPFGHSGTSPTIIFNSERSVALFFQLNWKENGSLEIENTFGAGDGTRTRNRLITNQLLYRLSYASENNNINDFLFYILY